MPKVKIGRLDGVWGMRTFSAADLYQLANGLETQILSPTNADDPRWLQRRANRVRSLAIAKHKAFEQKVNQRFR